MKYVSPERTPSGRVRYRFRSPWCRAVMRERDPTSAAFAAEYAALMASGTRPAPVRPELEKPKPGALDALISAYTASREWNALADLTRKGRSNIFGRVRPKHGTRMVATLTPKDGRSLRNEFGTNGINAVRALFAWAVEVGELDANPFRDVRPLPPKGDGFRPWKVEHVAAYIAEHPVGSMPHLALAILLFTGLRRSDAVRLGPEHVEDGWFRITTGKTGIVVEGPIHPQLQAAIDATRHGETFIVNGDGLPFSAAGFGNWFRDRVSEAELPADLAAHGVRKAYAEMLAMRGANEYEIMTALGHSSPRQSARYTKGAARRGLAESAAKRLADVKMG